MCGIAGAIDLNGRRDFSASRLLAMTRAIAHRGPDDEQIHKEPGVALGARRLSIVDLAGGRQPISNEDGSIWVTQNGELFEYPELQTELLARGHRLATRCDTELWAHLYEDFGEGFFEKTRGQFAVALWDRKNRTVILGRDKGRYLPSTTPKLTAGSSGARRSRPFLSSGWWPRGPGSQRDRPVLQHVLPPRHDPDVFRGDQIDSARPLSADPRRPGRASEILGPRFPRCRRRAPVGRSDAARRRARAPHEAGGRAPAARRCAGRQLHQWRPRFDCHPGPELPAARQRRPLVYHRARQGRAGRAVARARISPGFWARRCRP